MNGYPPWSEAASEDLRGEEFLRVRLAYCVNKLAHMLGNVRRSISAQELSEALGLGQEVQGYICTALSLVLEEYNGQQGAGGDGDA